MTAPDSIEKEAQLEAQVSRPRNERARYARLIALLFLSLILVYFYIAPVDHRQIEHRLATLLHDGDTPHCDHKLLSTQQLQALGRSFDADKTIVENLFLENPSEEILTQSLLKYTRHPHLAGNLALARYTRDTWLSLGIKDVEIVEYEVLLNYPTDRSQISLYDGSSRVWSATLKEDHLAEDPGSQQEVPFFHGYSKNGSASGSLVYLNYGRPQDFVALTAAGIDLSGKIGIARYGNLFRGLKVELAQNYGMAAVLLYDDPSEDHGITEENGYKAYPNGPARNPSSVQRGSVQFLSVLPGDPTTPGYPSLPGCDRKDPYLSTPSIPSIPISVRDAAYLLATLNGDCTILEGFTGALPGVDYCAIGHGNTIIKLDNVVEYDYRPIYNVIAKIPGHFEDTVILGNHRDAWVRGASDPSSGSVALDSIVGTFAALQRTGYVPLRSLVFASWDAEEYGLVGSTEWVEEHAQELSKNAYAYLNVDVASAGVDFSVSASPFLFSAILNATEKVPAVRSDSKLPGTPTEPLKSLRDEFSGYIRTLGSGSDYTAFQDALGITSADMGFQAGRHSGAVYHYHSQYDSSHWLMNYGDPGLRALQGSARLWGLLAYQLAESPVIAFNASLYGSELIGYVKALSKEMSSSKHNSYAKELKKLAKVARKIHKYGIDLDHRAAHANAKVKHWDKLPEAKKLALLEEIHKLNEEYKHMERGFLDPKGLPDRSFFKHMLYAPGRWTGYAGSVLPAITEATEPENIHHAIQRVTKLLKKIGTTH